MHANKMVLVMKQAVVLVSALSVLTASAADYTWDASGGAPLNDGGGAWVSSGGANWFNGSTYGAWGNTTADKAIIGVGNGAAGIIYQSGTNVLNKLTFNAAGSGSYSLNQTAAGANVLSFGGTAPAIYVNSSASIDHSQWEADDNIAFAGDTLTVNIASGQTLTTRRMKGANANSTAFVTGGGTLRLLWDYWNNKFLNYSIDSGSVLHLEGDRETPPGTNTISGSGTLRISGGRFACSGGGMVNLSLGSGGVIDIQSGCELYNGEWSNIKLLQNRADMNVDGKFDLRDGNAVYVDALTGSGIITKAKQWNNVTLTVGVDNGSGTFSGTIVTNAAALSTVINLVKTGSGMQTLSGLCQYAGATTVNNGVLRLAAGASLNPATVVSIDYPGKLDLDSSINQTVKQLMLDGVPKAAGTWGSTSSAADNKSDMYFQGTGIVTVVTGPKAYTWDADGVAPLNDGAGSWVASGGANWLNGSTYGAWGNTVTDVAIIGANSGAAGSITQSGTVTLNGLVFNAPGSGNYTLDQSAVTGVNTLSFGGTGPAIIVNTSATIAQAEGGDDRMELASGNLTINIASGQTLTTRKLAVANPNYSVIVTGGGTLNLLYEGYNKFMEGIYGNGSATLFVKGNSTVSLAQNYHCISDYVRVDIAVGSTFDLNSKAEGVGYLSGAGSVSNLPSGSGLSLSMPSYFSGAIFSGTINGPGELYIAGAGASVQVLSGANTYAGGTRITRGTLKLGAAGVIPDGSGKGDLSFDPVSPDTATFDLAGNNETINGLSSSGTGSSVVNNTISGVATLTVGNDNDTTTFGGAIKNDSGTLALTKVGTGTLVLSGTNNAYSGLTTISGGMLCVSNTAGSATGSGSVLIASAGTLTGSGTVSGIVTNSGTLSPGSLIGTLTTGGQVWNTGGKLTCEMNDATGAAGTGYDTMPVNGVLNFSAATTCTVKLVTLNGVLPGQPANFTAGRSYTWTLAVASGGITGFSSDRFVVDKSSLAGPHGSYKVETNGNALLLKYSPVGTMIRIF